MPQFCFKKLIWTILNFLLFCTDTLILEFFALSWFSLPSFLCNAEFTMHIYFGYNQQFIFYEASSLFSSFNATIFTSFFFSFSTSSSCFSSLSSLIFLSSLHISFIGIWSALTTRHLQNCGLIYTLVTFRNGDSSRIIIRNGLFYALVKWWFEYVGIGVWT